jgi:hypothetical protein
MDSVLLSPETPRRASYTPALRENGESLVRYMLVGRFDDVSFFCVVLAHSNDASYSFRDSSRIRECIRDTLLVEEDMKPIFVRNLSTRTAKSV